TLQAAPGRDTRLKFQALHFLPGSGRWKCMPYRMRCDYTRAASSAPSSRRAAMRSEYAGLQKDNQPSGALIGAEFQPFIP
ncbi:MAG: hypothetical protein WBY84_17240, partial [Pseudolabrys sp.]